jgi:hypothetical protein
MDRPSPAQIDEAVSKSLKNKETPPKRKHERNIILASWAEKGAEEIFADLFKRPLNVREISCYKCLIIIHKLLREGHPKCIADAYNRRNFFASLIKYYGNSMNEYGRLSAEYAVYITAKLNFHVGHRDIDGTISLEKWLENHKGVDPSTLFDTVTHLLDLQQSMLDFQSKLLNDKELTDCRVSPLIPCVIESYNIYCLSVHLLKMLAATGNNADVFSFLADRFRTQYGVLRKYYFTASNIRFVTSIIAVPVLAPEPPQFGAPRAAKEKKVKSPRREEPEPVIEVEVPDFNPRGPNAQTDIMSLFGNVGQQQPPPTNPSPFFNEWMAAQSQQVPAPVPAPVPTPIQEVQVVIKKEIPEDVLRRLAELERRVRELEAYNQQLTLERNALANENGQLKKRLAEQDAKLAQAEAARRLLLEEQLALAKAAMSGSLSKWDDPNYLGNQSADCEGLLEAVERLKRLMGVLVSSVKDNSSHTPQAGRDVSEATVNVLGDAKGIASLLEDLGLKGALLSSSKNAADAIAAFLEAIKSIVGQLPNALQTSAINRDDAKIRALLEALEASLQQTLASQRAAAMNQRPGVDLEDIAERELLAAAKMIEDAAAALEAQRAKRMSTAKPGELDVEESIMAAAMAITAATQGLVKAATDAQHERVLKGKASDPSAAKYHHDPMWIEGLISAARAVAEATRQLVGVANDAFQGRIDDAALIAASKAVGASTAQLVAATRSKTDDIFSKTQTNLDNAAAAVTRATQALVRAAKNNQEADFEAMAIKRNENIAAGIKAEIEQQARILRLEKELEGARRVLHGMNKSKYADAGIPATSPRPGSSASANTGSASSSGAIDESPSPRFAFSSASNASLAPSSSATLPRSSAAVETFNTSIKDLQSKVGASIQMRVPPPAQDKFEPTVFDTPANNRATSATSVNAARASVSIAPTHPSPANDFEPTIFDGPPPSAPPLPARAPVSSAAPVAQSNYSPPASASQSTNPFM